MNNERTPAFYLANLGSEVSRLLSAHVTRDKAEEQRSLERARKIFVVLEKMPLREAERAEIALLKEVVEDLPKRERFSVDEASLESYFYPFARKVLGV